MPLKRKLSNIANEIYFNQFSMDEYLFYILTRLIYIKSNRLLDETSIWTMKKYNDQFYDGRRLASDLSMIDKIINDKNSSYKKLFFVSPTGTSLMYELVMEKLISPITYINLYEREVRDENLLGFHKRTKEYESFNGKIMNTVLAIRQHVVRLH